MKQYYLKNILFLWLAVWCLHAFSYNHDQFIVGTISVSSNSQQITVSVPSEYISYYNSHDGFGGFTWSVMSPYNAVSFIGSRTGTSCTIKVNASKLNGEDKLYCSFSYWLGGVTPFSTDLIWEIKKVTIVPVTNISVSPSSASLKVGETKQLSATISPSNATDKSVTWSSSNASVATVSNSGQVTAKAEGSATITCMANDGSGVKGTCNVTVVKIPTPTGKFTAKTVEGVDMTFYGYSDGTCCVDGSPAIDINTSGKITIPSEVNNSKVIRIGSYAFQNCKSITQVIVPNSVTEIEKYVFENCSSLTSASLGDGVKKLSYGVFYNCTSLTTITGMDNVEQTESNTFKGTPWYDNLPDGLVYIGKVLFQYKGTMPENTTIRVKDGTIGIGNGAFNNCTGLVGIYIPESVNNIGWSDKFEGCTNLSSITVSPENKTFDSRDNCNAVIETATNTLVAGCNSTIIPNSVKAIGRYVFYHSGIKSINIPDNVETIGDGCFSCCDLLADVRIGKGLKRISFGTIFHLCPKLKVSVSPDNPIYDSRDNCYCLIETATNKLIAGSLPATIPSSVKIIGEYALYGDVLSLEIPDGVETIEKSAFHDYYLSFLTLGRDIKEIAEDAFSSSNLTIIQSKREYPTGINENAFKKDVYSKATLYVPIGAKARYQAAAGWNKFENIAEGDPVFVLIDESNFPDENFRNYLLNTTYGSDGKLTEGEIRSITNINVYNKEIKSLKGIEHFIALTQLSCGDNQLTALDVSKNTALKELICYHNQLTVLDVSKNMALTELRCYNNQLTDLDVSKNTAITELYCSDNQLTTLDVSKNTALTELSCGYNQLTALDVSKNTALTYLVCGGNQLATLDVSRNTALTSLVCYSDKLMALDVSKNTVLTFLNCTDNQLTALDVSKNNLLTELYCHRNQIKGTSMDNLVNGLPKNTTADEHRFRVLNSVDSEEGNVCTVSQVAVAKERGWRVLHWKSDPDEWADYTGSSEYIKGDVNSDGQVNGTDLVALTNMILGKSNKTDAADVNGDGQVNGTDYVALVNIVLGRTNGSRTGYKVGDATAKLSIEPFDINAGEEKEMVIDLTNPQDEITLVQFDLKLPSGLSIKKVGEEYDFDIAGRTTWRKHSLDANDVEGGATRLLLSSSSNATLSGTEGAIIKITLKADNTFSSGDIQLENILLVTPSEKETKQPTYTYHVGESQPSTEEACLAAENFSIMADEEKELVIDLLNPQDEITLVQFDLRLPSGLTLKQINGEYDFDIAGRTTWRKHSLDANATDGIIRFLLSSSSNATLSGTEGAIIKMTLNANNSFAGGTIILENILLVTPDEKEIKPAPLEINTDGTGIHAVMMNESDNATLYSISGQRLSAPKKGINIINGRKVILK